MSPKSVFDLVKTHIRLPIARDYGALKRVLRDWQQYTAQVSLQEKPTFPAELLITITRTPPFSCHSGNGNTDFMMSKLSNNNHGASAPSTARSRRWSLWKSSSAAPTATSSRNNVNGTAQRTEKPFVYRKVVPLHVWTAVLPWEMQRGLSFSDLTLPPPALKGENNSTEAEETISDADSRSGATSTETQPKDVEDDPYGVVTPAASTPPTPAATLTSLPSPSAHQPSTSTTAPVPTMLFLSDVPSTKAYGIGFWSGAIRQPIDVLFVGPTLPISVGPSSASFQHLRNEDGRAAVEDNHVSQQVLTRYFPLQEMQASPSSSSVTLRVHSFSHLDPLPFTLHPCRLGTAEGRVEGLNFTASPDAPYNSILEAPRYIFETPRHTLQPAVRAALQESQRLLDAQTGLARKSRKKKDQEEDQNVSIDLVVNFSEALRHDVFAKAQLCVEYVSLLEEAIAHYAQELNTDRTATGVAADPLEDDSGGRVSAGDGTDEKPIKVWLSEHESLWMTPAELRDMPQRSAQVDERRKEEHREEGSYKVEEEEQEAKSQDVSELINTTATSIAWSSSSHTAMSTARKEAAAAAVGATPAQPDAVSAGRSISLQSPMLHDETEGRPSYLAPSFVGRHESSTLRNSSVVLSADKLARYPKTNSHMPQLPPVDYELYDLCVRLGVGQQAILYHYHERILREWRAELQRRRRLRNDRHGGSGAATSSDVSTESAINAADVQRMVALVRDRSLQLPPELVSLVEAVAAA